MNRQLIMAQIPSLRRYALALTGNQWAADDLVQDTLERACNKWRLWSMGSNLRAWLFTIMHNVFVNQLRRDARSHSQANVDIDDVVNELQVCDDAMEQRLDLQRCLLRLPPDQRAVLLLISVEDLSYAQAAQVLNVPIGTVMSRLSRARHRLQALMEAKIAHPEHPLDDDGSLSHVAAFRRRM